MKQESRHRIRLLKKLRSIPNSWWVKTMMPGMNGIPDFLGCVNGIFVALEQKTDEKASASKLQLYELFRIRQAGGYAEIIHKGNENDHIRRLSNGGFIRTAFAVSDSDRDVFSEELAGRESNEREED